MTHAIACERPDGEDARKLIEELEAELSAIYPSESRHGYSVEKLLSERVAFFVIRLDGSAAGCGGIQLFGKEYGEVKRMYVRPAFRGLGLGKAMLDHLAGYALSRKVGLLRLETGVHQKSAIELYEAFGFHRRAPFGEYKPDPLSAFFEMPLART